MPVRGSRMLASITSISVSFRRPSLDDPDAGQLEALLVDLRRLGRDAARNRTADLDPVRDADRECDHAPADDDGLDEADVARVRAALVRDVRREHVALAHAREAVLAQDALHLRPERAREEREAVGLRDDLRIGVGDAAGEVEHLVDDRAHARAGEHHTHLVGRGVQLLLDDLDGEGIEALDDVSPPGAHPSVRSQVAAIASSRASSKRCPTSITPTGRPSASASGSEIAGWPDMSVG